MTRFRTLLICHHDAPLHADGFARWLASWSDLAGVVVIEEPGGMFLRRVRREAGRVGWIRMLDVLAFRLWYRVRARGRDQRWIGARLRELRERYPESVAAPVCRVPTPNAAECEAFIRAARPDIVVALCKNILAERVFGIPAAGTVVLHPGICPEYRNAHGCFWALANDDLGRVGLSLLRIDRGIDTGPVCGYFTTAFDEQRESHIVIQHRMILDNLEGIRALLERVAGGTAAPIDTSARASREWGQPWLSAYWRWRRQARRRARAHARP